MATTAPPVAESKKPASAPPAKAAAGTEQSAAATPQSAAGSKQPTSQPPAAGKGSAAVAGNRAASGGGQQNFDRLAVRAKLAVSEPGDAVEREADAIADQVLRIKQPPAAGGPVQQPAPLPAAAAAAAGGPATDRGIQRKPRPAGGGRGNGSAGSSSGNADHPASPQQLVGRLGPGEPLDAESRAWFEARLGCDLGGVRIHTDSAAATAAAQIEARAFTYGSDIAFASGEFQPGSDAGKRLLGHELAHVLQQSQGSISRMLMRQVAGAAPAGGGGQFDVAAAELEVPPIKARHLGGYGALSAQSLLKRQGAYDASARGTKQGALWTGSVKVDIDKIPAPRRPSEASGFDLNLDVAGGAASKVIKAGSREELTRLLQQPTWNAAGEDKQFQVDHMVEYQLGGADAIDNMELLDQAHNGSVGSSFSHGIKRTIREELRLDPTKPALADYSGPRNAANEPTAEGVMQAMTVVFKKIKGRARESGRTEGGSMFWSRQQIEALDHVLPLLGGTGQHGGTAASFALLSPTGNLLIAQLAHSESQNAITIGASQSGGMAGFRMKRLLLDSGYNDAAAGAAIGSLEGVLDFGPAVAIPPSDMSVGVSQACSPGTFSGKVGAAAGAGLPNQVDFKPMSPLLLEGITFGTGLFGKATLQPSHPALAGIAVPATLQNGRLGIQHTIDASALAGNLKLPGLSIDSAAITLAYDGVVFSASGGAEFTIRQFGSGYLNAALDSALKFELSGGLRADTRLFDQADMKLWYRSEGGFGGSGTLAITQPGKIKGLKSARLAAKYEDSVLTASGDVIPDIPGLRAASLSVAYENDALDITGKLAIDDKVPGIEKADITVAVKQDDAGWKVGASGSVTPKLPGLTGAQLQFSYDDGWVLVEGEFAIDKGPLHGKVTAGVTNAAVDDQGLRTGQGSGNQFKVFGAADIDAVFIKDKLDGKLKLRLLADGSVRVGGGLKAQDFEVFGKYPKDGGQFLDKTISSPPVPLPGLGFSVGSVSVGVTFSASVSVKAHANVGPGKLSGITVEVAEFDPAQVDLNALEISGGARFDVYADAGLGASAQINLIFGAAVAELVGSVGAEATVGIPAEPPVLSAQSRFTYSQAKGLDLVNTLQLNISPALKFRLFGLVSARINVIVDTITVWSKDFTLAEANYKLPVAIVASGSLGYNSKTGKITPDKPADAIRVEQPKLDGDAMKGVLQGDSAPAQVRTVDDSGKEALPTQPGVARQRSTAAADPAHGDRAATGVDEGVVDRLGVGMPLDLATRGQFEQAMQADLSRVLLHTGPAADREARRLSADAFAVGDHIAFAEGQYRPETPEGQRLIAHELAHVVQQRGGAAQQPIVLRWPAVTRTTAQTSETPASIRARTLASFSLLTQTQLDWATSADLQADAGALGQFRDLQTFADGPDIVDACGDLPVGDIIARGIPGVYPALRKYTEGVTTRNSAWLRRTASAVDAERWGIELATLEAAWPAANLSLVMRAPDPVGNDSPFEKLDNPAAPELGNFINYLTTCNPVLSASDGSEIDSFLALRRESALPQTYAAAIARVRNYHHFTKVTLDGLIANEAFPQWRQQLRFLQRPLTVVLYPAVDHNGAFHRNLGVEAMVTSSNILTIVIEGHASVADYQAQLAPVAARYGVDGRIAQAMVAGHGNSTVLELAGSAGAGVVGDRLGTVGATGTNTTNLMAELTRLMSVDPARRRIVLDACLTDSHHVARALRAAPADAAADVHAAIVANPSLRDFVAGVAGAGAHVFGANASFAPAQTSFLAPGGSEIGLSVPGDPDLIASKIDYVEFGTEPEGCMRAVLECWAADQRAGSSDCRDAMLRRIGLGRSAHVPVARGNSWRESIIHPLYGLAANHYWGNGDAIRQLGTLAGSVFELYWPGHVTAASLNAALAPLAGNAAHVDQLLARVSADPHYAATPRVAIVIEQAWMQHTPARRAQFLAALGGYASCLQAAADLDLGLVMAQLPLLLTLPPPAPPPPEQLRLALLAAHHAPVGAPPALPLPAQAAFLRGVLGAGPTFAPALGVGATLGGLASESEILDAIGRPLGGAVVVDPHAPPPTANVDTDRDAAALNDFHVAPLRRTGIVATASSDLMVRSTPTTSSAANIFARLPKTASVSVIGETGRWYAIEQPGRTGFVAKRYIRLLP